MELEKQKTINSDRPSKISATTSHKFKVYIYIHHSLAAADSKTLLHGSVYKNRKLSLVPPILVDYIQEAYKAAVAGLLKHKLVLAI